jgi:hypothetical protein
MTSSHMQCVKIPFEINGRGAVGYMRGFHTTEQEGVVTTW